MGIFSVDIFYRTKFRMTFILQIRIHIFTDDLLCSINMKGNNENFITSTLLGKGDLFESQTVEIGFLGIAISFEWEL